MLNTENASTSVISTLKYAPRSSSICLNSSATHRNFSAERGRPRSLQIRISPLRPTGIIYQFLEGRVLHRYHICKFSLWKYCCYNRHCGRGANSHGEKTWAYDGVEFTDGKKGRGRWRLACLITGEGAYIYMKVQGNREIFFYFKIHYVHVSLRGLWYATSQSEDGFKGRPS